MDKTERASDAIKEVFEDTSVTIEDAIANLESLAGEIDIYIDALRSDLNK